MTDGSAHMQPILGNFGEFCHCTDSIVSYLKRMQLYFESSKKAGESIANFIVDLRRLSIRLVTFWIWHYAISWCVGALLLTEENLTNQRAQEITRNAESTDLYSMNMKADTSVHDMTESIHHSTSCFS